MHDHDNTARTSTMTRTWDGKWEMRLCDCMRWTERKHDIMMLWTYWMGWHDCGRMAERICFYFRYLTFAVYFG